MLKRTLCLVLSLLLLILSLSSCDNNNKVVSDTFVSMDTVIEIKLPASSTDPDNLFHSCRKIFETYSDLFDCHIEDSEISAINSSNEKRTISKAMKTLLSKAKCVFEASDGAFDITIKPVLDLWERAEKENRLPTQEELEGALLLVDSSTLTITEGENTLTKGEGQRLDVGGIAKGAAAETVVSFLREAGVEWGIISVGGNIAVFGERDGNREFNIGIRNPRQDKELIGTIGVCDAFVSVSGDYERYYTIDGKRYHHIIDPKNGYPSDSGLCSVVVISKDGTLADALSTALFVLGADEAIELYNKGIFDFEAILISENEVVLTEGLEGKFTLKAKEYKIANK